MGVRVSLLSRDKQLAGLMREAFAAKTGGEFSLQVRASGQPASLNDLCIWDFFPGETILPECIDRDQWRRHLFVLHRKDLGELRELTGVSDVNVLLKPVTRATVQAFVEGYRLQRTEPSESGGPVITVLRRERNAVLQSLMEASVKLQQFYQERNNFLARSIHDFRAPLTAISGYCELLLGDELDPLTPGQRKILKHMQQSAKRLTRATNAMSQLSAAENTEPTLNLEHADIRECLGQALETLSTTLEDRQISVTVTVEGSPEQLRFDKAQVEQALVNLIESACKFTPRGGTIEVSGYPFFWESRCEATNPLPQSTDGRPDATRTANSYRVDIRDWGPAIPAAHADRIFEQHTSYAGGQDRSGAGLGMAICRMIVSQHGGHVWAASSPAGAVFSFGL